MAERRSDKTTYLLLSEIQVREIENPFVAGNISGIFVAKIGDVAYTVPEENRFISRLGMKRYELVNHLGNVQAVISDRALPVRVSPQISAVSLYTADLLSATDYYPFGMVMAGRSLNTNDYRYGFNGKEFDQDWDGGGATYDYGFRIYDPRMCRFLSVDPLTKDYPELTPFQFASNSPIQGDDIDGLELRKKTTIDNNGQTVIKLTVEAFVSDQSEFFSKKDFRKMRSEFKKEFKRVYSGNLDDGTIVHAEKAKLKYTEKLLDPKKDFFFEIKDLVDKDAKMIEIAGDDETRKKLILNNPTWGSTDRYENMPEKTEYNRFEVKVTMGGEFEQNSPRPTKSVVRTALHELGHSAIDEHDESPGNLMNATMTGDQIGGKLNSNQLKKVVDTAKEN